MEGEERLDVALDLGAAATGTGDICRDLDKGRSLLSAFCSWRRPSAELCERSTSVDWPSGEIVRIVRTGLSLSRGVGEVCLVARGS